MSLIYQEFSSLALRCKNTVQDMNINLWRKGGGYASLPPSIHPAGYSTSKEIIFNLMILLPTQTIYLRVDRFGSLWTTNVTIWPRRGAHIGFPERYRSLLDIGYRTTCFNIDFSSCMIFFIISMLFYCCCSSLYVI